MVPCNKASIIAAFNYAMRFYNHHPSQRCHVRFFLPCAVTDTQEFHLTFVVHRLRGAPLLAGRGSEDHGGSPILCVLRQRQREEQEKKQERGRQELHDLIHQGCKRPRTGRHAGIYRGFDLPPCKTLHLWGYCCRLHATNALSLGPRGRCRYEWLQPCSRCERLALTH